VRSAASDGPRGDGSAPAGTSVRVPGDDPDPGWPGRADRLDGVGSAQHAEGDDRSGRADQDDAADPDRSAGPSGWRALGRRVRPGSQRETRGSFLRELPVLVLIAFVLALLIKALLIQAFWIPSESMERTLLINDRVLVNKVVYHFRDVHRGEIVVFNGDGTGFEQHESMIAPPHNAFSRFVRGAQNLLGLGAPSDKDFIKRVIGVSGDTVQCCDASGRVMVNGKPLDEPYVYQNDMQQFGPVKVPAGRLWVMGDHRGASSDSRANGTIPQSAVVGRAFVRVWPLSRAGFLTVPHLFSTIPSAAGPTPAGDPAGPVSPPALPVAVALGLVVGRPRRTGRRGGLGGLGGLDLVDRPDRPDRRVDPVDPVDPVEPAGSGGLDGPGAASAPGRRRDGGRARWRRQR
jgi:signal peptidase I